MVLPLTNFDQHQRFFWRLEYVPENIQQEYYDLAAANQRIIHPPQLIHSFHPPGFDVGSYTTRAGPGISVHHGKQQVQDQQPGQMLYLHQQPVRETAWYEQAAITGLQDQCQIYGTECKKRYWSSGTPVVFGLLANSCGSTNHTSKNNAYHPYKRRGTREQRVSDPKPLSNGFKYASNQNVRRGPSERDSNTRGPAYTLDEPGRTVIRDRGAIQFGHPSLFVTNKNNTQEP